MSIAKDGIAMCKRFFELDAKIEHYQDLKHRLTDRVTVEGINELIERMKVEKTEVRPPQQAASFG